MSIVTDSTPVEDPKNPEESIIIDLFNLVGSDKNIAAMKSDFANGGFGYGDFKKRLFADFWDYFQPMREKREQLSEDLNYVDGFLLHNPEIAMLFDDGEEKIFEDLFNLLKDGGKLILTTQNSFSLNFLIEGTYNKIKNPNKKWLGWDRTHIRFYTPNKLRKFASNLNVKKIN